MYEQHIRGFMRKNSNIFDTKQIAKHEYNPKVRVCVAHNIEVIVAVFRTVLRTISVQCTPRVSEEQP